MLSVSCESRTPRCSSRCCCWAPFPRAYRPGNGSNGPERRRRRGGDTPGMWAGRGRAEKPRPGKARQRGRLESRMLARVTELDRMHIYNSHRRCMSPYDM